MDVDAEVDRIAREAAALWNAGKFFACHDKLEEAWQLVKHEKKAEPAQDPRRDLIHGIILFCAAYVHWEKGNVVGVGRKLTDAERAFALTKRRSLGGHDLREWIVAVAGDLRRGTLGERWDVSPRPAWP